MFVNDFSILKMEPEKKGFEIRRKFVPAIIKLG